MRDFLVGKFKDPFAFAIEIGVALSQQLVPQILDCATQLDERVRQWALD